MPDTPTRNWAIPDVPPEARPEPPPRPAPCRCGHPNTYNPSTRRDLPVRDLRDDPSIVWTVTEREAAVRLCFTCDHGVAAGGLRATHAGSAAADYYHRECVVFDPLALIPGDVVVVTYQRNDGTIAVGHALVTATRSRPDARPEARLIAPHDLADAHRDPADGRYYPVYADQVGRVTDPAIVATVKGAHA